MARDNMVDSVIPDLIRYPDLPTPLDSDLCQNGTNKKGGTATLCPL